MKRNIILIVFIFSGITLMSQSIKRSVFDNTDFVIEIQDSLNTVASDISPVFIKGNLYYTSVPDKYFNKRARESKNMAFYDLFSVKLNTRGHVISNRVLVSGFGNDFHEGPAAWCDKTEELFNTFSNVIHIDTTRKVVSQADIRLRLVCQKYMDGKWMITEEFPFNNKDYNFAHPAISTTGDTLIFSSNMKSDSFGKIDLYMSVRVDGTWTQPVNLGEKINTKGNEMFPTFLPGGLLSFASDSRNGGFGNLDIWYTTFPEIGEIKNAGNKINSRFDDFGLSVHKNRNVGYFASNRQGNDDIYRIDFVRKSQILRGKVIDGNLQPVEFSTIDLLDCNGKLTNSVLSGKDGFFEIEIIQGKCPVLKASKVNFKGETKDVDGLNYVELTLRKTEKFIELLVLDKENNSPVENSVISCNEKTWTTDLKGFLKIQFNEAVECALMVRKSGYLDQSVKLSKINSSEEYIRDTVYLYKKELNKTFVMKNIFYDYNKWNILPESKTELNNLIKIMNDNPGIKVELGSHTDSRGDDLYNQTLSQKRSDSAINYIISNGISSTRIVAKGYGESQLVNRCQNGVNCSDKEHRLNRRTEFKIIGM